MMLSWDICMMDSLDVGVLGRWGDGMVPFEHVFNTFGAD